MTTRRPAMTALPRTSRGPRVWPEIAYEMFEERAGILEYEAGLPREQAEREAEEMIRTWWATEHRSAR